MTRRSYTGAALPTTLASPMASGDTSATIASAANLPTSNFVLTIDQGLVSEEKILVGTRTGTTISSLTRGYDTTVATSHVVGATVLHTVSAVDLDEANAHVNDPTQHAALLGFLSSTTAISSSNHTGYADLAGLTLTLTAPSSGQVLLRLNMAGVIVTGGATATIEVRANGTDLASTVRATVSSQAMYEWLLTGLSGSVTLTIGGNVTATGSMSASPSSQAPITMSAWKA